MRRSGREAPIWSKASKPLGALDEVDGQLPGAQVQLEKLPEIRLVLDHQHFELAAVRPPRRNAGASLKQFVHGGGQDPAMAAGCLPGAQQSRLGPELHRAQRNAEAVRSLARRTDILTGIQARATPCDGTDGGNDSIAGRGMQR